jgi:hypothetical protein
VSKYEIDDEVVRGLVDNRDLLPPRLLSAVAALEAQIPLPVPKKVGAVVRTVESPVGREQEYVLIRWATDSHTHSPWIEAGNHEQPWRTDEIGRITEVLFEGVDL